MLGGHHLHDHGLVEVLTERVVAQLGEANIDYTQYSQRQLQNRRVVFAVFGCPHDRHDSADALEHEKTKADRCPVGIQVDWLPVDFFDFGLLDFYFHAESRDCDESDNDHGESEHKAHLEGLDFANPSQGAEKRQHDEPKVLGLQVLKTKNSLDSRLEPLNDEGQLGDRELKLNDCKAHLQELFSSGSHGFVHDVSEGNLFDVQSTLCELDGAHALENGCDYQGHRAEQVTSVFESFWSQQNVDCAVALARGEKGLHICHFLGLLFQGLDLLELAQVDGDV